MILGFGLGSMIGVAAGLFHMINNALYKSGLFLSAGCVEYRTGKEDIDDLGGLSKAMPFTFFATLIFAMSISGVPPFNGFASKWMIYQGIIDFGSGTGIANKLWVVWLGLAVLGSALTLASFIKLIGGIFLGRRKPEFENVREVPVMMWMPLVITCCILYLFRSVCHKFRCTKTFYACFRSISVHRFLEFIICIIACFNLNYSWNNCLSGISILKNSELKIALSEEKKFRIRQAIPQLNSIRLLVNSAFFHGSIKKQKNDGLIFMICQNICSLAKSPVE